jgi:hypothetical protein
MHFGKGSVCRKALKNVGTTCSRVSSVLRGKVATIVFCSVGVWALDALALGVLVRSLGVSLSLPENLMLLSPAPRQTAPGYVGKHRIITGRRADTIILSVGGARRRARRRVKEGL